MTAAEFTAFYPQFAGFTPAAVPEAYICQANARFTAFAPGDAEEARRLYVAHKLTLYARTSLPDNVIPDRAQLAAAGEARQRIAGKKVGEVSVTYAAVTGFSADVSAGLADLAQTEYGMQLLSLIRLYGRPVYVP